MKRHLNNWFFGALIAFFPACKKANILPTEVVPCPQPATWFNHPKAPSYQAIIDKYVKQGLPGISVLIEDSIGTFTGVGGYADIDQGIHYTPCHISKVASITKLMVGTLTMKLQEEGKLNIDDPISKYISNDILSKIDKAEGKTIRQLMNHTTGIYDVITSSEFYLAILNNPNKTWSQEELLSYVYGKDGYDLSTYPAYYSNTNTVLLSMCIKAATGVEHHLLLREKIIDPLRLSSTYYQGHESIPSSSAQGYFDLHNNGTICNVSNLITGSGNGYGGIFSNVFDLQVFIKALLIDKTLLTQASLDQMQQFVQEDEDFYTGLSTIKKFTNKKAYGIGHTGRDLGYSADLFYFPEQHKTLVFFVNYGTNGKSNLKPVFQSFESDLVDAMLE